MKKTKPKPGMKPIHIGIADDHPIVREGLKLIIAKAPDLIVSAEASNGQEVLDSLRKHPIDVLLLDISMPVRNGMDVLKHIRHKWPKLPILILTAHPEAQYAVRAFKLGASGYLTKESLIAELITAIRTVLAGKRYVSNSFAQQLVANLDSDPEESPQDKLSNRELEVLRCIAEGKALTTIAEELFLSVKTISTYRTRILDKLHMQTNADIIRYAIRCDLVQI